MNDKQIREFAASMKFAPAYRMFDEYIKMTEDFVKLVRSEPRSVFGLYDMRADSMNGVPTLLSLHATLEGADAAVPDNLRFYVREPHGNYVKDYSYVAIREMEVLSP